MNITLQLSSQSNNSPEWISNCASIQRVKHQSAQVRTSHNRWLIYTPRQHAQNLGICWISWIGTTDDIIAAWANQKSRNTTQAQTSSWFNKIKQDWKFLDKMCSEIYFRWIKYKWWYIRRIVEHIYRGLHWEGLENLFSSTVMRHLFREILDTKLEGPKTNTFMPTSTQWNQNTHSSHARQKKHTFVLCITCYLTHIFFGGCSTNMYKLFLSMVFSSSNVMYTHHTILMTNDFNIQHTWQKGRKQTLFMNKLKRTRTPAPHQRVAPPAGKDSS